MRLNQVTAPAIDLAASISFYQQIGLKLIVRSDHYARFELPEGGSTFSLHVASEAARAHAPVIYFECDVDSVFARLKRAGIAFETAPVDQSWLWREASLRDPAGNQLVLYQAGENRLNPPWRLKD
jgi:catechol 2,3-dioxygenase-like lactoylglutathione lyase family enzyme